MSAADPHDEHYMDQTARLAREVSTRANINRSDAKRIRALENAIRNHATASCDCMSDRECLAKLYRLVPVVPRKKRRP